MEKHVSEATHSGANVLLLSVDEKFVKQLSSMGFQRSPLKAQREGHVLVQKTDLRGVPTTKVIGAEHPSSGGSTLRLAFKLKYVNGLGDPTEEKEPVFDFFTDMTQGYVRHKPHSDESVIEFEVDNVLPVTSTSDIEARHLMIRVFSHQINHLGEFCLNDAGGAAILISDLVSMAKKDAISINLRPALAPDVVKGELHITDVRLEAGGWTMPVSSSSSKKRRGVSKIDSCLLVVSDDLTEESMDYATACFNTYREELKPLEKALSDIHTYTYVDASGPTIPSVLYHDFNTASSVGQLTSEEFWGDAIVTALNRYQQRTMSDKGDVLAKFESEEKFAAKILADTLTFYPNYCPYITDEQNIENRSLGIRSTPAKRNRLVERFDIIEVRKAGDCEDDSNFMIRQASQLRKLQELLGTCKNHYVDRLASIARQYHYFATLGGVASMTIGNDFGKAKNSYAAHEWMMMIPCAIFYKWIESGSSTSKKFRSRATRILDWADEKQLRYLGEGLDVLVCEGTGFMHTEGSGDDISPEAMMAMQTTLPRQAMSRMKMVYDYRRDGQDSRFYQRCVCMFTADLRALRMFEFIFVRPETRQYGEKFSRVVSQYDKVSLVTQPPVPERLYRGVWSKVKCKEHPTRPIKPPRKGERRDPAMLKLSGPANAVIGDNWLHVEFMVPYRSVEHIVNSLAVLKARSGAIIHVGEELISGKSLGGYHVNIYFPPEKIELINKAMSQ